MPTFFGRRYLRSTPGPIEKCAGAFVLILLAGIIVIFLLTGGLLKDFVDAHPVLTRARSLFGISEKPLFLADRASLPAPAPPRELRLALSMLPVALASLDRGQVSALPLQSENDARSAQVAGVDPELTNVLQARKAHWIYFAPYGNQKARSVVVQIADLDEPASALAAWQARTPKNSRPVAIGRSGWIASTGSPLGFWAGRYYTELAALDAAAPPLETVARTIAGAQLAYGLPQPPAGVDSPTSKPTASAENRAGKPPGVARFAEVPGGKIVAPTKIERYTENLYEKIDGKESAFRAFCVVDLKFAQYAQPDKQQSFDVYVYDMAAPLNAMGIHMSERVEKAAALPVGRDGYVSGTSVFFWKGQYYVNVLGPPDGGEPELAAAKQIAAAIAETIADAAEPFWADKVLPAEDRIPNSFSYQASSALGYEFLQRMFFARYEVGGKRLQMFLTKAASPDAAQAMFVRFTESTARYDKVLSRAKLEGGENMLSESPMPGKPSRFGAAFNKGPYFGGVSDAEDRSLAEQRAKALFDKLSAADAGDPAAATAPPPMKPQADHGGTSESSEGSENGK